MTQIEINRKDLIEALRIGGSMSGKSKAIAILEYAKIAIKGNVVKITSTDTECCIAHKMFLNSVVEEECTFVVSPKDLSNALKSLKGDDVKLWIEDSCIEIKHANGTMAIPTMPASEFPLPTLEENMRKVAFDSEKLFNLINRGKEFMSTDELHPIMCGVYLYVNNQGYGVASTDTHKLFTESVEHDTPVDVEASAVIQARAIVPLLDVINGSANVNVMFGERQIVFRTETSMLSIVLPSGMYPRVSSVIPKSSIIECEINKDEVMDAINRALLFSNATGLLTLSIENMLLAISSEDFDTQKRSYEECICSSNVPEKFVIGVNGAKFKTCLSTMRGEKVMLKMNAENKPILMEEDNSTILLMPMMIS